MTMTTTQAIYELTELRKGVEPWAPADLLRKLADMQQAFEDAAEVEAEAQAIGASLKVAQQKIDELEGTIDALQDAAKNRTTEIESVRNNQLIADIAAAETRADVAEARIATLESEITAVGPVAEVPRLGMLMRARLLAELPDDDDAACDIVVGALAVLHGLRISTAWAPDIGFVPAADLDDSEESAA
jgi:hypothetical protein